MGLAMDAGMQQLLLEILFASILASPSSPVLAVESAPPPPRAEGASRPGNAPAATASSATRASAGSLAIEVIEAGAGPERRFALTVPVDGELDAWVDGAAGPRHCRASARPLDGELQVELKCSGRKSGDDLRLRARRSFGAGERVQVAAVERGGGRTAAVFVQARP